MSQADWRTASGMVSKVFGVAARLRRVMPSPPWRRTWDRRLPRVRAPGWTHLPTTPSVPGRCTPCAKKWRTDISLVVRKECFAGADNLDHVGQAALGCEKVKGFGAV